MFYCTCASRRMLPLNHAGCTLVCMVVKQPVCPPETDAVPHVRPVGSMEGARH